MSSRKFFRYAVDRRFSPVLLVFGFRPKRDGVELSDDEFVATFGFLKIKTPRSNIDGAHVTRNYRWWTAIGIRASWVDDGLSFGSNYRAGVCIHFKEKVPSPLKRRGHSALTVTVEDVEGLAAILDE